MDKLFATGQGNLLELYWTELQADGAVFEIDAASRPAISKMSGMFIAGMPSIIQFGMGCEGVAEAV